MSCNQAQTAVHQGQGPPDKRLLQDATFKSPDKRPSSTPNIIWKQEATENKEGQEKDNKKMERRPANTKNMNAMDQQ